MKTFFKLILASILLVGFSQCGTSKDTGYKFEKRTPFKVKEATYQSWVAGVQGGGAGITVIITLEEIDTVSVTYFFEIEAIYFREQKMKAESKGNSYQIIGRYKSDINQSEDIILHRDAVKEYGNVAPIKNDAINQFNLLDDEAIISYYQHGKLKYYKLKLSKKASEFYQ